jgi:hypothetical protein
MRHIIELACTTSGIVVATEIVVLMILVNGNNAGAALLSTVVSITTLYFTAGPVALAPIAVVFALISLSLYLVLGAAFVAYCWDWHVCRWRSEYEKANESERSAMSIPRASSSLDAIVTAWLFWPVVVALFACKACAGLVVLAFCASRELALKAFDAITEYRLRGIELPEQEQEIEDADDGEWLLSQACIQSQS